jgi:hypothetical protein
MAIPELSAAAQRLYDQVRHLEVDQPEQGYSVETEGWPWATICKALAAPIDPLYDLLALPRHPWQPAYDLDAAPDWILPWLAQHEGVDLPPGLTPDEQRAWIRDAGGRRRGRPESIRTAARNTLTGNQYVFLKERDGSADVMTLVTRTSETPGPAFTLAKARAQAPAGLQAFNHVVTDVRIYLEVGAAGGGTYAGAAALYGNYAAARGF